MALLTLTSDIGHDDYLTGAIKGLLLNIYTEFQLIDISHNIHPFNYSHAAYVCKNSFWHFPPYTFHLLLVNLFETKPKHLLIAFCRDQYIVCADNGLLGLICGEKPDQIIAIDLDHKLPITTLSCIGVLASTIKSFLNGKPFHQLGREVESIVEMKPLKPTYGENWMEGQIINIDNFENVVINITQEQFEMQRKGRRFKIVFKRDEVIDKISSTYADVPLNEKLALFNSAGYLEIAINKGNAAGLFGLQVFKNEDQSKFQQSRLFYQKVRIFFE